MKIENSPDALAHGDFLKMLMEALEEMKEFGRIHMFQETFYDLVSHAEDRRRQAAVVLLQRLIKREKDGLPPLGKWKLV